MLRLRNEEDLLKLGFAVNPSDPSKAVPIGRGADRQQAATPDEGRRDNTANEPDEPRRNGAAVPISQPNTKTDVAQPAEADSPHSTESFARETSSGPVGDLSDWDDQALLAGMKKECGEICALDTNYPGRYHRLGTFVIESNRRFGEEATRLTLRVGGISRTIAHWAARIAELYTYAQAVQFTSGRAIIKTLPQRQPRKPKAGMAGDGGHQTAMPQKPPKAPVMAANDETTIVDRFIKLGIEVREMLGDEAFDDAVEQIRAHAPATFEQVFVEV